MGVQRRRRWTPEEKLAMVQETYEPGMPVLLVVRRHGIKLNELFQWCRLERDGALITVCQLIYVGVGFTGKTTTLLTQAAEMPIRNKTEAFTADLRGIR